MVTQHRLSEVNNNRPKYSDVSDRTEAAVRDLAVLRQICRESSHLGSVTNRAFSVTKSQSLNISGQPVVCRQLTVVIIIQDRNSLVLWWMGIKVFAETA